MAAEACTYICRNCGIRHALPDYAALSQHLTWNHNCPCSVINEMKNGKVKNLGPNNGENIDGWYQLVIRSD